MSFPHVVSGNPDYLSAAGGIGNLKSIPVSPDLPLIKKLHSFFPAGLRGTCLVFFFYIVINCFGSVPAAIA
jgi:hypothetical protein